MSKPGFTNITTAQTFQNWFDKTNDIVDLIKAEVVTASGTGDSTTGDATLVGDFTATNVIIDPVTGGSLQADIIQSANTLSDITFSTLSTFEPGSKITAVFAYGASGGQVRFTNNIFSWDVGINNNNDADFVIKNAQVEPLNINPEGVVTLKDLIVTGNTTLGASGSVAEIAHDAFKAGDNIVFTGPDANNQITISAGQSYDGTGLDIVVPRQVSHQSDADTRIRFDHMSGAGARNGQTYFENNGHVMMYIHGEERSTDRRIDFILKNDLLGNATIPSIQMFQQTNGLGTDVGKASMTVEGIITAGLDMVVNSDGSASNGLQVQNDGRIELLDSSDNVTIALYGETGDGSFTGNLNCVNLVASGDVTAGGDLISLSDIRVKENVQNLSDSLNKVTQMRGVSYNKIGEQEEKIGFIAQELEEILPQVITETEDGYKHVAYGNIVPMLVEAIKELNAKIEKLENKTCSCGCDK